MRIKKEIHIKISYQLQSETIWHELRIKAQDYYDKDYYDDNEEVDIDSLPRFDHAISYIALENKAAIKNTKLCIQDKNTNETIVITESYWNFQRNSVVERTDTDMKGTISNQEIIVTTLIEEGENKVWEIIRFSKVADMLIPVFHSYITENDETFISEDIISIK